MGRKSEFSREEKIAAVKLVTEGRRSLLSVANEYGIHENTQGKWKQLYATNPESSFTGEPMKDEATVQDRELQQLRRQVRELEAENDFLKKFRHTLQRTRGKVCGHRASSGQGKRQHGVQAVERPAAGILRVPEPQGQPARGAGSCAHDEDQGRLLREQADLWSAKDPGKAARRRLVDQSEADSQADGQGRPDAGILAQACADDRIRPRPLHFPTCSSRISTSHCRIRHGRQISHTCPSTKAGCICVSSLTCSVGAWLAGP